MSDKYDAVVLSGGGIKGIFTLGVLHYFYEKGEYDPNVAGEYAGTSIGSVIALLLVCGYLPYEIFLAIYEMESFFSTENGFSIWDVFSGTGLISIDGFAKRIEELVLKKMEIVPTLKELYELTGKKLSIPGTNVTKMYEEKYSPSTTPDLNSVKAVKMSCNLPLIFQRLNHEDCYIVDGGLINNFPIDYISDVSHKRVLGVVTLGEDISIPVETAGGYLLRCMMLPINEMTKMRCRLAPENVNIIQVVAQGDSALLQLSLSAERKTEMFMLGYNEAKRKDSIEYLYASGWNDDPHEGWDL